MEEEQICRMSIDQYRQWRDTFVKHSSSAAQVAIDTETLYDKLVKNLKLQVVVSPKGSMSSHILILLDEAKKLSEIHHVYHFQWVDLDNDDLDDMVGTVISEKRLNSEFAWVLADLIRNLQ